MLQRATHYYMNIFFQQHLLWWYNPFQSPHPKWTVNDPLKCQLDALILFKWVVLAKRNCNLDQIYAIGEIKQDAADTCKLHWRECRWFCLGKTHRGRVITLYLITGPWGVTRAKPVSLSLSLWTLLFSSLVLTLYFVPHRSCMKLAIKWFSGMDSTCDTYNRNCIGIIGD